MNMLGVNSAYMGAWRYTGKAQKSTANETGIAKQTSQAQESSDAEKLTAFRKEIWNEINSMPWGANTSIQITDGALKKMMEDSEFKNKMMNIIMEDAIGSNRMCGGTLINIDENGYRGYSYMPGHEQEANAGFSAHSKGKNTFFVKRLKKKQEYRRLWEEEQLKKLNQKKITTLF